MALAWVLILGGITYGLSADQRYVTVPLLLLAMVLLLRDINRRGQA